MLWRLTLFFLFALALSPAWGQQVYVKNQPFSGAVFKDSTGLWVELAPLQWALNFDSELEPEGARVREKLVRTLKQGDKIMVPLNQIASAIGAVVKENPEFQTVDIHLAVRPKVGVGLDIKPADLSGGERTKPEQERVVEGQPVSTAAYAFTLPTGMKMTRDPRLIKTALMGKDSKSWDEDLKVDAMISFENDPGFKRGSAVFTWLSQDIPKEVSNESDILDISASLALDFLRRFGCQPVSQPRVMRTKGQDLVLAAGVEMAPPHNVTMLLLRIDPKRKRTYLAVARDVSPNDDTSSEKFVDMFSTVTTR